MCMSWLERSPQRFLVREPEPSPFPLPKTYILLTLGQAPKTKLISWRDPMRVFTAEAIGTMLLILLGDGVVAGVVLSKSKAEKSGWIVITTGWGLAIVVAVYAVGRISGAHINPAVTLSLAAVGKLPWSQVPAYLGGQMLGAFIGAVLVWIAYLAHWRATEDQALKLAVFSTGPAIRNAPSNFLTEAIG